MKIKFYVPILIWMTLGVLGSCDTTNKLTSNTQSLYSYNVNQKVEDLGILLKTPALPEKAKIVRAVRTGNLLFLSGKGPTKANGDNITGKVGKDLTAEQAYEAAKLVAINQLSILKSEISDLNKVVRIVKVFGMVNATEDFTAHSSVINGFSELMIEVFGDRGKHARAAVGMASLPGNIAVEVDMLLEIAD